MHGRPMTSSPLVPKLEVNYVDLQLLLANLLAKKWLILGMGLMTVCLATVYSLVKPTKYQATVLLQIHHKQENSLGSMNEALQQATTAAEEPISMQMALIRSKFILGPVIKALGLDIQILPQKKFFFGLFKQPENELQISELQVPPRFLKKPLLLLVDQPDHYRLYAAKKLVLEGNSGELIAANNLFALKIAKLSAPPGARFILRKLPESEVINQLRSHLIISDLSGTEGSSLNKVGILQLLLSGTNAQKTIDIINKIALITELKDRERKSLEAKKTLEFLYQQLPIIQASLKEAEEKLNSYRSTSGKIDIKLQTQYLFTHLSEVDKQLELIRFKKIDMAQQYTAHHPFLITLNQKQIELQKQHDAIIEQIKNLPATDQIAANLSRDVDVKNNLYMALLHKIHEQQVITAGIVSDIGILALATFRISPCRLNFLLLALPLF